MRRLIMIIPVILLVWVMPAAALAQELGEGAIEGQVINGTEGGGSVAGVEVTLIMYVDDVMAGTRAALTDDEGKFQFGDVDIQNEYIISAKYMGVDYYYPVEFIAGETTAYVEVGVCDATTSDEAIRMVLAHTIIDISEVDIVVTEVFQLVNDGDKTYAGTDSMLAFTLPEGVYSYEAPQYLMQDYQLLDDNRLAYLVPFPPGERQLIFSYSLAMPDSKELTIPLVVDYPTDSMQLLVSGEDIEVATAELTPGGPIYTDTGERYIRFWGEDIPRGTVINILISNLPGGGGGGVFFIILGVVIAVVVIAGIAVFVFRKKRRQKTGA
jgi:hypothetical protein